MARPAPEEIRMLSRDEKDDRSVEITQVGPQYKNRLHANKITAGSKS